jgi:hypothetical protein
MYNSDTSAGDKIEVYEFLEALGLLNNEVSPVNIDDDDNNESDIDEKDSDDDQDNYWDPRKTYTRWDYKRHFGKDALKKLYQTREVCHRNIVLVEFTRRLPNLSEEEKNGLFDVFFSSEAFGMKIHNALLDALEDPVKGWDLNNY